MMATLILELPPEAYHRLHEEANRLGKLPQVVAQEWLIERLSISIPMPAPDNRARDGAPCPPCRWVIGRTEPTATEVCR